MFVSSHKPEIHIKTKDDERTRYDATRMTMVATEVIGSGILKLILRLLSYHLCTAIDNEIIDER